MPDLEQYIAEWRRQMLAAGIQTPVPLDELESHLREEIERQMKSGFNGQDAFSSAIQKIGQAGSLKAEFKQVDGFIDRLDENKSARTNRILSVLWFALCTRFLADILSSPDVGLIILYFPHYWSSFVVVFAILGAAGVCGSILLFCGAKLGQYVIRSLAVFGFLLSVLEGVTGDESFAGIISRYWFGILAVFNLITIWLLRPPKATISTAKGRFNLEQSIAGIKTPVPLEELETRFVKLTGIACGVIAGGFSLWILYNLLVIHEVSWAGRLLGLVAVAATIFSWRYGGRFLPKIHHPRARMMTGLLCCFASVGGMMLFIKFLPHLLEYPAGADLPVSRLLVSFVWAWTAMAIFGAAAYRLEDVARKNNEQYV